MYMQYIQIDRKYLLLYYIIIRDTGLKLQVNDTPIADSLIGN